MSSGYMDSKMQERYDALAHQDDTPDPGVEILTRADGTETAYLLGTIKLSDADKANGCKLRQGRPLTAEEADRWGRTLDAVPLSRPLEPGETAEAKDIYRLDEYPEGQWLEVGLTGINGKRVGEMPGLQVRRPIKTPGKLYSGTIISGRLDLSVIPPEVSEAERTLYKYFSQSGNSWRFGQVASRELVEKMEEDSRHFADYAQQITMLHEAIDRKNTTIRRFEIMIQMRNRKEIAQEEEINRITADSIKMGRKLAEAQGQAADAAERFPNWLCFLLGMLAMGAVWIIVWAAVDFTSK